MRLRAVILFIGCAAFVSGCGIGLCAGQDLGGCGLSTSASASPHLLLSGLSGLSIRKNDCYPVTVSAVDAAGNTMSVAATATITASSGVVLYSSLSGCQTYDSSDENNTFYLTLASPTATFYFRSDVDGAVTLSASTTADTGLSAAEEPISVAFEAFDNASGPDGVPAVAVQGSSGYIYLGGPFGTYDDVTVAHIARLDSSGVLDTSFSATGTGLNSDARSIAIQADGKIIVGGVFTSYNGTSRSRVARLNTDGSLDTSFADVGTGLNGSVVSVAVQSDGQIVVGGWFTSYNGTSRPYMARLNTDGSLDTTFAPTGTGLNNYVSALGIQPDGNIVVTGEFTSYNGTSRKKVARLTSAGALDATFAPTGTSLTWGGQGLTVQPDGKVLVWGFFTDYNATPRNYLARLNSDGTLD